MGRFYLIMRSEREAQRELDGILESCIDTITIISACRPIFASQSTEK